MIFAYFFSPFCRQLRLSRPDAQQTPPFKLEVKCRVWSVKQHIIGGGPEESLVAVDCFEKHLTQPWPVNIILGKAIIS